MKKPRKKKHQHQPEPATEERSSPRSAVPQPAPSASRAVPAGGDAAAMELAPAMAEALEPTISRVALPMIIIPLLGLLVYFADMYVMDHSGKFNAMVYYPNNDLPKPPGGPSLKEHGRIIYEQKAQCAQCHQANGAGSRAQNAPPLAGSDWVLAEGPNRLIRIVLHGLSGPITVSGEQWGGGAMIGWREILTDDKDIAAVLTYIRQSWGNNASDVTPEQVKAIRAATADRSSNWTAPELLQVPDKD